jgi:hypothetical protein
MASRHALLIATESYTDPALRRLTAPGADARELAAVLSDPSVAGFEVTTLIDEPHHVVGEAIGEFYRGRRRDELTLLYFTGHGVKDDDGSLYLAMANTRRDSLMFTALAAELVDRAMAGCASRQKVLVLDCCYSGAFPAGKLAKAGTDVHTLERFQGRGRAVLTASDATQYSFEGEAVVGSAARSVFTRHLVAGLRDGSADLDGDGDGDGGRAVQLRPRAGGGGDAPPAAEAPVRCGGTDRAGPQSPVDVAGVPAARTGEPDRRRPADGTGRTAAAAPGWKRPGAGADGGGDQAPGGRRQPAGLGSRGGLGGGD